MVRPASMIKDGGTKHASLAEPEPQRINLPSCPPSADRGEPEEAEAPQDSAGNDAAPERSQDSAKEIIEPISHEKVREQDAEESSSQRVEVLERRESVALIILAVLAVLYTVYAARAVLMPTVLALLLALTLRPLVRRLRKFGIPEVPAAALMLGLLLSVGALGVSNLLGPAREWAQGIPDHITTIQEKLRAMRSQFQDLTETTDKVQELATAPEGERPVVVQIAQSKLSTNIALLSNTGNLLASTVLVLCLTFFLLAWGDALLNNVLHLFDTWSEKKRTVELVHDVERGVASYLSTVTLINICLGIVTATAMWLLGVPNPMLWGVMATLFNYIPVFGAVAGFLILGVVSLLSFDSAAYAVLPPVVFAALTAIEGNLITPSILGKSMSLNPILVFVSLVFWGWVWGIGGAFLAVPMLAVTKLTCERFEKTQPLATLMETSD